MTPGARIALVPGALALLPQYAGLEDPVAALRAACIEAVAWLGEPVTVLADAQGRRVAEALLAAAGASTLRGDGVAGAAAHLVVGNGSARRTEKAPGHLDERAAGFDDALRAALVGGDRAALTGLDQALAAELWASTAALPALGEILTPGARVGVDYDDDPFGVQYWVVRWELAG